MSIVTWIVCLASMAIFALGSFLDLQSSVHLPAGYTESNKLFKNKDGSINTLRYVGTGLGVVGVTIVLLSISHGHPAVMFWAAPWIVFGVLRFKSAARNKRLKGV